MADLEPAYLLVGNDRPKLSKALSRMRRHFADDAIEVHDATAASADDVIGSCESLGLFAERRLIIVHGADQWKADDVTKVVSYLASPSPDAVLMLTAEKLAANSRLKKAFPKQRLVECKGPEKEADVVRWVARAFQEQGVEVPGQVAQRLVRICGHESLDRLASDVARIVTYAGGEPVTADMIDTLATPGVEQKVWELTDAWASRDRTRFLCFAEQLLQQREHPVRLTGVIGRHLRFVHMARRMLTAGDSPSQVLQQLQDSGANRWVASRYVDQAQRIGLPQADAALARVAMLEAELKGGSALASSRDTVNVVFERGLCELV